MSLLQEDDAKPTVPGLPRRKEETQRGTHKEELGDDKGREGSDAAVNQRGTGHAGRQLSRLLVPRWKEGSTLLV